MARVAASAGQARVGSERLDRRWLTFLAALPVAAALAWSLVIALPGQARREAACWVLPNARVLLTPGDSECPLRANEQILHIAGWEGPPRGVPARVLDQGGGDIAVTLLRNGREESAALPVREVSRSARLGRVAKAGAAAVLLLAIPLLVLWNSRARATVPFAFFYSAVGVVTVTAISGRSSEWLTRAALLAMAMAPAAVAHLSLTFPRERKVLREAPEIARVPYALCSLLVIMGWVALERTPLIWPTFMVVLDALTVGVWTVLILSCAFAIRESSSAIERQRARLLCFGALLLPAVPTVVLSRNSVGASHTATAYVWMSAAVIPLPIGLAISRYNLFNLNLDMRRWVGRAVYFGAAALLVGVVLEAGLAMAGRSEPFAGPGSLLLVSLVCVSVLEPLRGRLLGFLEARMAPRLEDLRRLRRMFEQQMGELSDEDAVAGRLGEVLERGLSARAGAVHLYQEGAARLAYAFGTDAPVDAPLLRHADTVLTGRTAWQLEREPVGGEGESEAQLEAAHVEVVVAIEAAADRYGLVLLGGGVRGSPYNGAEVDFAEMVAAVAGNALRNARVAASLLDAERSAATGRVALGLAHDLGKELDWVRRLVRRLPKHLHDRPRLVRDIASLQDFADGLVEGLRQFVREAVEAGSGVPGSLRFDDLVDRAIRDMERMHGPDRITQSIDPTARGIRCPSSLGRVLGNLLDNALHAAPPGEVVHLFASADPRSLRLTVQDSGPGIAFALQHQVFRPGFTTRKGAGGLGIGLSVCREIVDRLGGCLELESRPGEGTRASLRVPLPVVRQS